jgi:carboxypeptidase Q
MRPIPHRPSQALTCILCACTSPFDARPHARKPEKENDMQQTLSRRECCLKLGALAAVWGAGLARAQTPLPGAALGSGYSAALLAQAAVLRDAALKEPLSYDILESLCTEVGPRLAGSPGDALAVAWAEAKFKALGFDKVWLEPVSFPAWVRGAETAEVLSPYPHRLVVTALGYSQPTPPEGLTGEVVMFDSLEALKAAAPERVRGRIVLINQPMRESRQYGAVSNVRTNGASVAAKLGAIAFLLRSAGTHSHRLAHTGVMNYDPAVAERIPAGALSPVDADLLAQMSRRGQPIRLRLNLGGRMNGQASSFNVIGEMRGSELPDEYVLIGGHLDSWDLGTGAVDDGAGCAITMAAAVLAMRFGGRPKRSIRVVLFANEEQGLWGGKAYAQAHQHEAAQIIGAAEADAGQGPVLALTSRVMPHALPMVRQMQQVMAPLGVRAGHNEGGGGPDLGPLAPSGVALFGLQLDSTDYFELHHTADDTFDKIRPERIQQATAAYAVFAWMAANAPSSFGSGAPIKAMLEAKQGR